MKCVQAAYTCALLLLPWHATLARVKVRLHIVLPQSSTWFHALDLAVPRTFLPVAGAALAPLTHSPSASRSTDMDLFALRQISRAQNTELTSYLLASVYARGTASSLKEVTEIDGVSRL